MNEKNLPTDSLEIRVVNSERQGPFQILKDPDYKYDANNSNEGIIKQTKTHRTDHVKAAGTYTSAPEILVLYCV